MKPLKIERKITPLKSYSFEKYLNEIARLKVLTADQEQDLARKVACGDKKAEHELIIRNLKFVVTVAKQNMGGNLLLEDLVSEGNMGLIKAAQRFDESRGFKFISYAVWWIRQSIMSYVAENSSSIRLPSNRVHQMNKLKKLSSSMEQELSRTPTNYELFERIEEELSEEDINILLSSERNCQSLDQCLLDGEENSTLLNIIEDKSSDNPDQKLYKDDLKKDLKLLLEKLSFTDRFVITNVFGLEGGEPKTLSEIGEELEISRERVRQIRDRAIRKCNTLLAKRGVRSFKEYFHFI